MPGLISQPQVLGEPAPKEESSPPSSAQHRGCVSVSNHHMVYDLWPRDPSCWKHPPAHQKRGYSSPRHPGAPYALLTLFLALLPFSSLAWCSTSW